MTHNNHILQLTTAQDVLLLWPLRYHYWQSINFLMVQAIWLCLSWPFWFVSSLFWKMLSGTDKCLYFCPGSFLFPQFLSKLLWFPCTLKVQRFSIMTQRKRKWLGFKVRGGKTQCHDFYYVKWEWIRRKVTCIFCSGHYTLLKATQNPCFPGHESSLIMWLKWALWRWDVAPDEIYLAKQRDSTAQWSPSEHAL